MAKSPKAPKKQKCTLRSVEVAMEGNVCDRYERCAKKKTAARCKTCVHLEGNLPQLPDEQNPALPDEEEDGIDEDIPE